MVKRLATLLLLFCSSHLAFGQRAITGLVVDAGTGKVIPGCSVFITNTSKGTITDNTGHFELSDVPSGKHQLIISSVGYETSVFTFSEEKLPIQLKVELKIKVRELANVIVESYVEETWEKWGRFFLDNFIGSTANSKGCTIKNAKVIRFKFYKKSNRLVAYADEALLIENKALGYTIHYQLEKFEVNFNEESVIFLGYSLFEESSNKKKYAQHRQHSYKGSMLHFIRSVYTNTLIENGFEVRRMTRIYNLEKLRVKKAYAPVKVITKIPGSSTQMIELKEPDLPQDTLSYYQRVMRQPDFNEVYGEKLLTADSLVIKQEGLFKIMYFPGYLFVTYTGELEEDGYIRTLSEPRNPASQRSFLFSPKEDMIRIEKNGHYFDPQNLFALGYWGWSEKLANALPLDYENE